MSEPALKLVGDDGEIPEGAPQTFSEALTLLQRLDTSVRMLERDIAGKRLRIAELEADREQEARDHPLRPQVDAVHACWKRVTAKRRPLHFSDVFSIAAAVNKLGFDACLRAIVGAKFDPYTKRQRNGQVKRFNDLDTIFKTFGKVSDFAGRAPEGWAPDPVKIAAIAKVDEGRVREWLGEART